MVFLLLLCQALGMCVSVCVCAHVCVLCLYTLSLSPCSSYLPQRLLRAGTLSAHM
jgi:hypothetical protein